MDQESAIIYHFPMSGQAGALAKTEEAGATPLAIAEEVKEDARGFLIDTRRKLTLDEAASAAGIQWFQYEIQRLDRDNAKCVGDIGSLREVNERLVSERTANLVKIAVLEGVANRSRRNEILSTLTIAAGSAGLGSAPAYYSIASAHNMALTVSVVSIALVLCGVVLRMWK